jgi:hypothetical protein
VNPERDFPSGGVFTLPVPLETFLRNIATIFLIVCISAGITPNAEPQVAGVEHISLLQLIVTPERYDGKRVAVEGFLHLEFEGNAIYLNQNDYAHAITKNSIWVQRNPVVNGKYQQVNSHYVIIVGTFDAKNKGHMSMCSGSLRDITAVDTWPVPTRTTK